MRLTGTQTADAQGTVQYLKELLGRDLFFDTTLSTPAGMACASCHDPSAGFSYPNSRINQTLGPVPGVIPTRFGFRKPPTAAYAAFLPQGPPHYDDDVSAYVGGMFWDGRATDAAAQATQPFQNPNEMNNVFHNGGDPDLVVASVQRGRSGGLLQVVYGRNVFANTARAFADIADAIAAYEKSPAVSPFSSKYDNWLKGKVRFTPAELDGLRLVTGSWTGRPGGPAYHKFAQCVLCHGIPANPKSGPDLWTNTCYANIGVPRNPNNPYYQLTDPASDPLGYNPLGSSFVDLGLGDYLYPELGLPSGNIGPGSNGQGDYLQIDGTFKAPTLRNVAKAPSARFVKCYMHNGVFKSLKEVVHFYNTRNLTTVPGEVIDFTQPAPYEGLKGRPLWPTPEYPSLVTLQNPSGLPGSSVAQVGNLGLTDQEENDIVAFLQTLSDL
jgi:cytochrome c peroxidase